MISRNKKVTQSGTLGERQFLKKERIYYEDTDAGG